MRAATHGRQMEDRPASERWGRRCDGAARTNFIARFAARFVVSPADASVCTSPAASPVALPLYCLSRVMRQQTKEEHHAWLVPAATYNERASSDQRVEAHMLLTLRRCTACVATHWWARSSTCVMCAESIRHRCLTMRLQEGQRRMHHRRNTRTCYRPVVQSLAPGCAYERARPLAAPSRPRR